MVTKGRPTTVTQQTKWEMWQCRKIGIAIDTIRGMFRDATGGKPLSRRRLLEILAEQRAREGGAEHDSRGQFVRYRKRDKDGNPVAPEST